MCSKGISIAAETASAVVLAANNLVDKATWDGWAWRIPFLFSVVLLAVSLWVRLMLKESPVFQAMKEAGTVARNPLREFGTQ